MAIVRKKKQSALTNIRAKYPLSDVLSKSIATHRNDIEKIITGKDDRLLVIVGPCSAWPSEAVLAYARKLATLVPEVDARVKIVMRVYTQKPRTTKGWAGPIVQPNPFAPADIAQGAISVRQMMRDVASLGLPIADELLFTHKTDFIGDLLSWAAIGARSVEDQEHRVFASGLAVPVGMKNSTSGNVTIGVNSILSAQSPHTYYSHGYQYETDGNPLAHLVLRGGLNGPNFTSKHLTSTTALLRDSGVLNPAIIVDSSHDNTLHKGAKDVTRQSAVVESVLRSRAEFASVRSSLKGFLIESFIKKGNQSLETCTLDTVDTGGLSITDPCIGWDDTIKLIRIIAARV